MTGKVQAVRPGVVLVVAAVGLQALALRIQLERGAL
jgi:hypothetical protein